MALLFISHAGENTTEAVAIYDWLKHNGWDDVFFDQARDNGINPGERWERALYAAAYRCEAVIFLVSHAWLASSWCRKEFYVARGLGKRLFPVLIEAIRMEDLLPELTDTWQFADLNSGEDHEIFTVKLPVTQKEGHTSFSKRGLGQLRNGLLKAGLDPRFFAWPPVHEPDRPPYRGLRPLETDDAGIFFGRNAQIIEALDRLEGLHKAAAPRMLVVLGASGAGKSSFLRAGIFPRLRRDEQHFSPLPILRPERGVLYGDKGFLSVLEEALGEAGIPTTRPQLRDALEGDPGRLRALLGSLAAKKAPLPLDRDGPVRTPMLVISVDQSEELFQPEGDSETRAFLTLLAGLLHGDGRPADAPVEGGGQTGPDVLALFTIRSDSYEQLQSVRELEGIHQDTLTLPPMPKGSFGEVIKGPAQRLDQAARELSNSPAPGARLPCRLKIDEPLVEALLTDLEKGVAADGGYGSEVSGDAKDTLPLLAFTLERLFLAFRGRGCGTAEGLTLTVDDYRQLGGVCGAINAAVAQVMECADRDLAVPRDEATRDRLLRRAFIPHLAGIDPETRSARRRVARQSDLPADCLPLIEHFIDQRLLVTDFSAATGERTIEPAHEALLRQWSKLQDWLVEDAELLILIDGVKRAAKEWDERFQDAAWVTHTGSRLRAIERLMSERPDLAASLRAKEMDYLGACRTREHRSRQMQGLAAALALAVVVMGLGWVFNAQIGRLYVWLTRTLPYEFTQVRPLTAAAERSLKPGDQFKECVGACPTMVVVPAGTFRMGSPADETGRNQDPRNNREDPLHSVTIGKAFAVGITDVTFEEWDACVRTGGCPGAPAADDTSGFGRRTRPVINVSWNDAQKYVRWFSRMTGKPYRLLTEAEWEFAARGAVLVADRQPPYFFGNDAAKLDGYAWDAQNSPTAAFPGGETHPVGLKKPNPFGLYDIYGNVFQWVADCKHVGYENAPGDGSAWLDGANGDCAFRMFRGGSWKVDATYLRSAYRDAAGTDYISTRLGFRVARTLNR